MCAIKRKIELGFTSDKFVAGTHICLIYNSEEERRDTISKFLVSGIKTGEKVGYFSDNNNHKYVVNWLEEKGIEVEEAFTKGQLSISNASDTYHPNGMFVPEEMLETLKSYYKKSCDENYYSSRVSGEMTWALKDVPGSNRLMEYESKINDLVIDYPVTAICQYDANQFDGNIILECLKVHPYMIVHGQIMYNPFYISTKEYLNSKC